jgi:hypothetical protein
VVLKRGRPALALEVLVTHAVDEAKEAALLALGVPAVEIDAREDWEALAGAAIEIVADRSLGFAPCPACALTARADRDRGAGGEAGEIAELEGYRARGLLGARPLTPALSPAPFPVAGEGGSPLSRAERRSLERRFRCPECGGGAIAFGDRLARHACPGKEPRPVAWRGYDGALVELRWWRPAGRKAH